MSTYRDRSAKAAQLAAETAASTEKETVMTQLTDFSQPTPHTAQVVAALEDALFEATGREVEVPQTPTVGDLERLCARAGVRPSELVGAVERKNCPAWCSGDHPSRQPASHQGKFHAGDGITLDFCQGLGEDVTIHLPEDVEEGVSPARARALAAALKMAADAAAKGGQA